MCVFDVFLGCISMSCNLYHPDLFGEPTPGHCKRQLNATKEEKRRKIKRMKYLTVIAFFTTLTFVKSEFNFTTCPAWFELQDEKTYYELAYHDYTQYPTCPFGPKCIRSIKVKESIPEEPGFQIVDWFSINCAGASYPFPLRFNLTEIPGYFEGYVKDPPIWWKILEPGEVYPDTVVDFLEVNGVYEWVIEFQCKYNRQHSKVSFTGINFYSRSRNVTKDYMENMLQAARDRGLGVYMDKYFGTRTVYQGEKCTYPNIPNVTTKL